jgi:hypothetical protein
MEFIRRVRTVPRCVLCEKSLKIDISAERFAPTCFDEKVKRIEKILA